MLFLAWDRAYFKTDYLNSGNHLENVTDSFLPLDGQSMRLSIHSHLCAQ